MIQTLFYHRPSQPLSPKLLRMSPAERATLLLHYDFCESQFGRLIVASTTKGVCYMAFFEEEAAAIDAARKRFPAASLIRKPDNLHSLALAGFNSAHSSNPCKINLYVFGTDFQLKIWAALLAIPPGSYTTYGELAKETGNNKAARAVGTAIGSNPVALLIPCHRVVQASGKPGGYMWGVERKKKILQWEESLTR